MVGDSYCENCGKRIPEGREYCPRCGWMPEDDRSRSVGLSGSVNPEKKKKKRWFLKTLLILLAALLALVVGAVSVLYAMLGNVNRASELGSDIAVNTALPTDGVQNIALFGLDTRTNGETGHADATLILSIDRQRNTIKLTSIARDTLVAIDGYGESKLTHAFWWGKGALAVKTINQNFHMNITDYVYVNFHEFVALVDYVEGVTVEVSASEARVMNQVYAPELLRLGFDYTPVSEGRQRLTGAQALAYSRNRYSDSDIGRGNRQKEVLQALFEEAGSLPATAHLGFFNQVLGMCHTNLTRDELLRIALWAVFTSPAVEMLSLPDGTWSDRGGAVVYELTDATRRLHRFIYETDTDFTQ